MPVMRSQRLNAMIAIPVIHSFSKRNADTAPKQILHNALCAWTISI